VGVEGLLGLVKSIGRAIRSAVLRLLGRHEPPPAI